MHRYTMDLKIMIFGQPIKIINTLLIVTFLIFSLVNMPVCNAGQETPEEALKIIMNLYKTRNFDALFRERYTELHKARSEKEIQKVISRYAGKFSSDKMVNKVLRIYTEALKSKARMITNKYPQVTETDQIAEFTITNGVLRVYLMQNGKWGFHL